jgi:thymidylate synthase
LHVVSNSFNDVYNRLAFLLRDEAQYTSSPRGLKVRETLGVSFKVTDPRRRWIYNPARKFKHQYAIAESLWYLSGSDSTEWISYYAPFWRDISDDGETANSAYGARIFRPHVRIAGGRFTQWDWVKSELQRDPDSRRAIIHIKSPIDSIEAARDVPCTLALQFMIRDDRLHLVVNMRSSDLILGIANDVPAFTFLQEIMALELGLGLGEYIHTSNSLHVYERHWDMLEQMCTAQSLGVSLELDRRHSKPRPMSSLPPVDRLTAAEATIRDLGDPGSIEEYLAFHASNGDYWDDWIRVLASHRARILGHSDLAHNLFETSCFGKGK